MAFRSCCDEGWTFSPGPSPERSAVPELWVLWEQRGREPQLHLAALVRAGVPAVGVRGAG